MNEAGQWQNVMDLIENWCRPSPVPTPPPPPVSPPSPNLAAGCASGDGSDPARILVGRA